MTFDAAGPAGERRSLAAPVMPVTGRGSDYAELSRAIRGAGLLHRRPVYYCIKISVNLLLLFGGWAVFFLLGRSWWQMLVAVFLGVMFTQTAFIGHDAGHRQISGSKRADDLIGRIHGNLLIGLSYGWWISKHNRHHSHPNQVGRDPDIAGAAIAFTPDQMRARRGIGKWLAGYQAWLFFPMLLLEGVHLHVAGVRALLGRGRITVRLAEGALLVAHVAAYLTAVFLVLSPLQAAAFIVIQQGLFGVYLGCAFAPNHKGMPVLGENEKIDFLRRQVIASRNIRGGWLTDFAFGGLNYQIEHHLFPSMPRPSLRHAQQPVRAFCEAHGVAYHETGLIASYVQVLRHLDTVGGPLRPELEYLSAGRRGATPQMFLPRHGLSRMADAGSPSACRRPWMTAPARPASRPGLDGQGRGLHTGHDEKPARAVTRRPIPGSPFNKLPSAPEPVKEFTAHDLVTHDRHGLGRVISTDTDTVLIDFGTVKCWISAPYAKLTKL